MRVTPRASNGAAPLLAAVLASVACIACAPDQSAAGLDELRQPTGLALVGQGRWLVVTNGNWDHERLSSSLVAMDLRKFEAGL